MYAQFSFRYRQNVVKCLQSGVVDTVANHLPMLRGYLYFHRARCIDVPALLLCQGIIDAAIFSSASDGDPR